MAESFSFDNGYVEFYVNGDANRKFGFCPTDFNLLFKIQKKMQELMAEVQEKVTQEIPEEQRPQAYLDIDKKIREGINSVFGYDICNIVFGDSNLGTSLDQNSELIFVGFLKKLINLFATKQEEAEAKRIGKNENDPVQST